MTTEILSFWNAILNFIKQMNQSGSKRTEEKKKLLQTIFRAVNRTRNYLSEVETDSEMDRHKQSELADLWLQASVALSNDNEDLARRCFQKSDYWANTQRWNDEQLAEARIKLDDMYNAASQLLN